MKTATKPGAVDRHILFTHETIARLDTYLHKHFPGHRALSMVVDRAVAEYLERHKGNGKI